ncbi:2'-5' RNA ligase family protein [Parasphingopyxis marina]|uniref:2'-5' RNA ligase family protein n=1 Tax=Parasphingopyxis marina TaxID=2761622 RepID=A0A842HZH2_9SPHN|nr:2'-5' RNA ligase family protein [Parasphingopyxis marina]MBC2777937.1 2'-5' RNA ligase family protein [Parasphingopyxis marina]
MNAPIVVTALFGPKDFAWLDGLRKRHFPAARNLVPAHLTLFHHLPPTVADELKRRLSAETRGLPPPAARISKPMLLGQGVAFRVVSDGLEEIREGIADAFETLLVPQDRRGWQPHVTIQNKADSEDAKALFATLSRDFKPRPLAIAGLASWYYRGGPWEPLSRHMFSG